MSNEATRVWRRAAVYGSLWAAVEIVVGSFLHNLRIPFAGGVLSAVGVMLMTAGHRAFPERGLIWRAALVCALMKSVSPSAVILGPMIGILTEGLLLEATVRLFRGRVLGYLLGGALAVSWPLAQRLFNALITFGPNVVRLYTDAYTYAARSLGVTSFGPFDLIAALVVLQMAAGCLAAMLGLGIRPERAPGAPLPPLNRTMAAVAGPPIVAEGNWSLPRLALVTVALLGGMAAQGRLPLWAGGLYVVGFAAFVLHAYPRAAARLRRPSLWIELAAVMLLAGLVLGGVRHGLSGLLGGVAAGASMALRATMVILGFAAVSVELRNPSILAWLERRRLSGLSDALGVAFSTLPAFTSALSDHRDLWRRPRRLGALLLQIADRLVLDPGRGGRTGPAVILTGSTGAGKTTLAQAVVAGLRDRRVRLAGILAPGLLHEGRRTGFDIVNIATGETALLARERPDVAGPHASWGPFAFTAQGLALGRRALACDETEADVVVVDEVGPFELSGGGWAQALDGLVAFAGVLVFVVRDSLVDEVRARWGSTDTAVYPMPGADPDEIADRIQRLVARARVPA